jgi:hypothetical protein
MKYKSLFLTSCILAIVFNSCKKYDRQNGFPSETKTGANTFGSYVDKIQLIPCKTIGGISPVKKLEASSYHGYGYAENYVDFGILAVNDCDKHYTYGRSIFIRFDSMEIETNKTYKFGSRSDNSKNKVTCQYSQDLVDYNSDSTLSGTITVTYYDKSKKIMSGKFEATLKRRDGPETVNITTGVFDVTF